MQSQAAENEQRFKHLVESMFDWVWEVDEHLLITYSSEGVRALLGYTAEETIGKPLLGFVAPDDLPRLQPALAKTLRNCVSFRDFEMWCLRASKERVCLLSCGVPIIDAQGQFRGFQGATRDITEQKRAEEALRVVTERLALATRAAGLGFGAQHAAAARHRRELGESETLLANILENVQDAYFRVDLDGRIVMVSPSAARMYGYASVEEMVGLPAGDLYGDPAERESVIEEIRKAGWVHDRVGRGRKKDGTVFWVSLNTQFYTDEKGRVLGSEGFVRDITERKHAEEALSASEVRYRRLFEAAKDGILILNAETGAIVDVNPFLIELLGYRHKDLVGKKVWEVGFLADVAASQAKFADLQRQEYVRYEDLPLETAEGRRIEVEFVSNSYVVDRQRVIQCNIRDITDRKRTEEALGRRTAQLEALGQVSLGITAQLDLDTLLRTITERALTLFGANAGELFLYQPDREVLELAVTVGIGASNVRPELRLGEGFAGKVWRTGKPLVGSKALDWPDGTDTGKWFLWESALGAPIHGRDEFLGVLSVLSMKPEAFTEADAELVELFATQAAVAIVNARLYAEVEDLTLVDELTQMFNRRGLLTLGPREVERSRRFRRPAAALYVDLDHLEELNGRFSHEVGDRVMQEVSRRIDASVRKIDVVARYLGEEFVVLLGEANVDGARVVAERIRRAVEATNLLTEHGQAGVTVSIGIAAYGPDVTDFETLIQRAREAVSVAQQGGGNRVVIREG